jgi:hypothetical protein
MLKLHLMLHYGLRFGALILAAILLLFPGVWMVFHGLQGPIDVAVQASSIFQAHLINASPGIAIITLGVVIICIVLLQGPPPPAGSSVRVSSFDSNRSDEIAISRFFGSFVLNS